MDRNYTVSIYVAAPGTPIKDHGTSAAGHVYYSISGGGVLESYGFAPSEGGAIRGPGAVSLSDVERYQNPFYVRRLEISKEQFEKLREFGQRPEEFKFDMNYHGATNSCIDFTWGALNHAGLHRRTVVFTQDREFEGSLKPLSNREAIKSIKPPYPDSELNKETSNPMPRRDWKQFLISDSDLAPADQTTIKPTAALNPSDPSHPDHALYGQIRGHVVRLDADHGRQPDETTERVTARLYAEAKAQDMSGVDHVLLSAASAGRQAGDNLFLVQGDPTDPAHQRATVPTVEAAPALVAELFARAEQAEQHRVQAQLATQSQDERQLQEQSAAVQRMG